MYYDQIPPSIQAGSLWVTSNSRTYWTFKVLDMFMDGKSVRGITFNSALVDTGTSALILSSCNFLIYI